MESTAPETIDPAFIASAFSLIAERGWAGLSVAEAARAADLPLDKVRARFPNRLALLIRFNGIADQSAVTGALTEGPVRDRIFDIVMRRIDSLQAHRPGLLALLRDLPRDPLTVAAMAGPTMTSMAWMLDAVAIQATGLRGRLRARGMLALWLATVNAWKSDESEDLSATMAALDRALDRAAQAEATVSELLGETGNDPS